MHRIELNTHSSSIANTNPNQINAWMDEQLSATDYKTEIYDK